MMLSDNPGFLVLWFMLDLIGLALIVFGVQILTGHDWIPGLSALNLGTPMAIALVILGFVLTLPLVLHFIRPRRG